MTRSAELVKFVQKEFKRLADPSKAPEMAAYMKTDMPFYGIQKPFRAEVYKQMKKLYPPQSQKEYESSILALWALPHREEKYAALEFATQFPAFVSSESVPLYERLIREGAWWDLVDVLAVALAGHALLKDRKLVKPTMERWIKDDDMWIRRSAILSQNHHKKETDPEQLFRYCLKTSHEREFFIRKAIGWALREYSYSDPRAVRDFIVKNKESLSPLSIKEGSKRLNIHGLAITS